MDMVSLKIGNAKKTTNNLLLLKNKIIFSLVGLRESLSLMTRNMLFFAKQMEDESLQAKLFFY